MQWLNKLTWEDPIDKIVFGDLFGQVQQQTERKEQLTRELTEVATHDPYREPIGWLRCIRGIDTVTAVTIVAELFDFQRFPSAKKLMAYLGLTPSERTSGETRRGGITKTGNGRVRRALIEAAQHSGKQFRISGQLRARRENQPLEVVALADRAMKRQNHVYWRLINRGQLDG